MIRESDVQWWILEAQKHPESAPQIIEELAKRLIELDTENEQLRGELIRLRQRTPSSQPQSAVQTLQRQVETLQRALQRQDSGAPSLVLIGDRLQAGQVSLSHAQELADQDHPVLGMRAALALQRIVCAGSGSELLLVTNLARAYRQMVADVSELEDKGRWPGAAQDLDLDDAERLAAVASSEQPPRLWTLVTRRGFVQRFVHAGMQRTIAQGESLLPHLDRCDAPIALVPGSQGDLVILSRWGNAIRFAERTIETQGSQALDLDPDDEVVGALSLSAEDSASYGIRRDIAQLPARSRPGDTAGKALIQARDVLSVFYWRPSSHLVFATYGGKLVFASSEDAARHDRIAKGSRLCDLGHDPAVAVAQIL
jgi:DNA gyrase/topoisomerase IV subunit A